MITAAAGEPIGPEDPMWVPAVQTFQRAYGAFPWEAVSDAGWHVVRDEHGGTGCGFNAVGLAELEALAASVAPGALAWLDQLIAAHQEFINRKDAE